MDTRTALAFAYDLARQSPDPSTQNGAVILSAHMKYVLGQGRNEFPAHVTVTPERLTSPLKYQFMEHAERNAIYDAAWSGQRTFGATMICPWFACADCGRAIINSGIRKVIGHKAMFDNTPDRWADSIRVAFQMFKEAGVETEIWEGKVSCRPILMNGELISP